MALHLCGFLAGTLCRLVTKEPSSVERHITCLSKDRFNSVFTLKNDLQGIPPPNNGVDDMWETTFKRFSSYSNMLMSALIGSFKYVTVESTDVRGALKAMCLLSLGGMGLGALGWAQKAADRARLTLCTFLSRVTVVKFHDICQAIYNFLHYNSDRGNKFSCFVNCSVMVYLLACLQKINRNLL